MLHTIVTICNQNLIIKWLLLNLFLNHDVAILLRNVYLRYILPNFCRRKYKFGKQKKSRQIIRCQESVDVIVSPVLEAVHVQKPG